MKDKVCPACERIMSYDSYFNKYVCRQCGYMEEESTNRSCTAEEWYEMIEHVCTCTGLGWKEAIQVMGEVSKSMVEYQWDGSGD